MDGVGLGGLSTFITCFNEDVEGFIRLKPWQTGFKDPVMQTWMDCYCLELENLASWNVFSEKKVPWDNVLLLEDPPAFPNPTSLPRRKLHKQAQYRSCL